MTDIINDFRRPRCKKLELVIEDCYGDLLTVTRHEDETTLKVEVQPKFAFLDRSDALALLQVLSDFISNPPGAKG